MKANEKLTNRHKSTRAIHAGKLEPTIFGEVSVPIFQTSTFAFPSAEEGAARFAGSAPGYIYTRLDNPTIAALETTLASLEGGGAAMVAATGMAAIATVFLTLLGRGDHVVATKCIYGATRVLLETELARFGVEV
ncbi:MAG: methionine gamma-lyase, partial [Syntrophobacteraceae bacterium CG07_land_8_20_14_0_80_61_8]